MVALGEGSVQCAAHCVAREECSSHHGPYLPPQIPLKTHHFDAGQTHHHSAEVFYSATETPQRKPGTGRGLHTGDTSTHHLLPREPKIYFLKAQTELRFTSEVFNILKGLF